MLPETKDWRDFRNVASCSNCLYSENKLNAEVCLGKYYFFRLSVLRFSYVSFWFFCLRESAYPAYVNIIMPSES